MKKKPKIIYINQRAYGRFFPDKKSDDFYLFGVGHFLAEQMSERYEGLALENWRCDKTLKRKMSKKVKGITCKIFPSIHTKKSGELSLSILGELLKEARGNSVLLHLMGVHTNLCSLIAWFFGKYPIVGTHLGGANFRFKYERMGNIRSLLRDNVEKRILSCYDHIFVQTATEKEYLLNSLPNKAITHDSIYGFDFSVFRRMNKVRARKLLKWPLDKKIILSVGRAYPLKGINNILDAYSKLRREGIQLFMVDIQPQDPLYSKVVESGAMFTGSVYYHRLPLYYSASDALVYLPFDDESLHFAGPGYVNLESLACGTPVVSTLLRHFPDSRINKVSRIPQKSEDVVPMIRDILQKPPSPSVCRSIVYQYYNWDSVILKHLRVYEQLFLQYYGINTLNVDGCVA
jgi:glycosyltransferase involved in cell wall biosynthesis